MDISHLTEWTRRPSLLLSAMANQKRLMILCLLQESERTVSEIGRLVDLGQSPLSQHLAKLRAMGLVSTRRAGQSIYYSLASEKVKALLKTLHETHRLPD